MTPTTPSGLQGARFTLCGDPTADARVTQDLARIGAGVGAELGDVMQALVLVGPFARGEGSVVLREGELHAVWTYPLVALVKRNPSEAGFFRALSRTWSELLDVRVDLRPLEVGRLDTPPPCPLWLDIARGHAKVVAGPPNVLEGMDPIAPASIPEIAVTRLVCDATLDLAAARLNEPEPGPDCARAVHNLALALGDAYLLGSGHFPTTVRERAARLDASGIGKELNSAYRDALRFRSRPDLWAPPGGELAAWCQQRCALLGREHLAVEQRRTGSPRTPARFARWGGTLFQNRPRRAGPLHAVRGWLGSLRSTPSPEEHLLRASVALAYAPTASDCRGTAARLLGTGTGNRELATGLARLSDEAAGLRPEFPLTFPYY